MKLSCRWVPYALALNVSMVSAGLAGAQEPATVNLDTNASAWTAERLANATSRDLPIATGPIATAGVDADPPQNGGISASSDARAPERGIGADRDARLYPTSLIDTDEGEADGSSVPLDFGTSGALFSSSKVFPRAALRAYPYSTSGKLFFEQDGSPFVCSAAVINRRLVLTAGHCVHRGNGDRTSSGFFENFLFVPAFHRGQAPYGTWTAQTVWVTGSWVELGSQNPVNRADFAILIMRDQTFKGRVRAIGEVTGWLGSRTYALASNHTKKLGYPVNFDNGQIMHQVDSEDFAIDDPVKLTVVYGGDMRGGSSGGPWVQDFGRTSTGQGDSGNYFLNRVVGVSSYARVDEQIKLMGSSTLNDEYFSTDLTRPGIFQLACAQRKKNCS